MTGKSLTGEKVLAELKKCGITHIVWLPDSQARFMYQSMMAEKGLTLVPVCREGEASAIAAGLWLGGMNPMVLHQNTGLFDSGDSLRGIALDLGVPLLMLIGQDSGIAFTEPFLESFGIKHYSIESNEGIGIISAAYQEAQQSNKPVAILFKHES